jgi:hypothetical protein
MVVTPIPSLLLFDLRYLQISKKKMKYKYNEIDIFDDENEDDED